MQNFNFKILNKCEHLIQYQVPWLNTTATISHLCKMTAATIQGRLIFEGSVYCNVIILPRILFKNQAVLQYQINNSICYNIILYTTRYLHRYSFLVN